MILGAIGMALAKTISSEASQLRVVGFLIGLVRSVVSKISPLKLRVIDQYNEGQMLFVFSVQS